MRDYDPTGDRPRLGFAVDRGVLSNNLRMGRKEKGLSQGQLSLLVRIKVDAISQFENARNVPTKEQWAKLRVALDLPEHKGPGQESESESESE